MEPHKQCQLCGKTFYKPYTESEKNWKKHKFCSFNCSIKSGIRLRFGKDNHIWKGDKVGYFALHTWVVRHLGKPNKCENCNKEFPNKHLQWANISRKYKRDLKDWKRLCIWCHLKYDNTGFPKGHIPWNKPKP